MTATKRVYRPVPAGEPDGGAAGVSVAEEGQINADV